MASKQPDLFAELEEIVECGVCLDRCRNPRSLPACLHTFCLECIKQLIDKSGQRGLINCPSCRAQVQVPQEGPDAFPSAFVWNALADTVDRFKALGLAKKPECSVCLQDGKHTSATKLCTDCEKCLCHECLTSHNKFMSNHKMLECCSIKDEDISEILRNKSDKCPLHGKDIELFCMTCNELLCLMCGMVKHADHDKQEVAEVASLHQSELEDTHDGMTTRVDHYGRCLTKVDVELQNRLREKQSKIHNLQQHGEIIIQQVRQSISELTSQIEAETEQAVKQLESLKQILNQEMSCLIDNAKKIKMSIKAGNKSTIINTNIKEKKNHKALLKNLTANHKLPKLQLDLQLTDVRKLTKQVLIGTIHSRTDGVTLQHQAKGQVVKSTPSTHETGGPAVRGIPKVTVDTWHDPVSLACISECASDGTYITLNKPGPNFLICNTKGCRVVRQIDGKDKVNFTLPDFRINGKHKLFARGQKAAGHGCDDDYECDIDTWGVGDNIVTTLYNSRGLKMATHTQTTTYT